MWRVLASGGRYRTTATTIMGKVVPLDIRGYGAVRNILTYIFSTMKGTWILIGIEGESSDEGLDEGSEEFVVTGTGRSHERKSVVIDIELN